MNKTIIIICLILQSFTVYAEQFIWQSEQNTIHKSIQLLNINNYQDDILFHAINEVKAKIKKEKLLIQLKNQKQIEKKKQQQRILEAIKALAGEFVLIKKGCFQMGLENKHKVCIKKDFLMGKYEVTLRQWNKIMVNKRNYHCGSDCPASSTWKGVQNYIKGLNRRTGLKFRLPTEAEWEYSARAGTTTDYNTGSCINANQANFADKYNQNNCPNSTGIDRNASVKVGTFPPNAWGLYDMHGNISEWTCTPYEKGSEGSGENCKYGFFKTDYVVRGGGFGRSSKYIRSGYRDHESTFILRWIGFRLVKEL